MIAVLAALALAGLALWILGPLRAPQQGRSAVDDARWKELVDAKHAIYRSILDLEFDRAVGKVSEADYTFLRRQHEGDALAILGQMDAMGSGATGHADAPGDAEGGGPGSLGSGSPLDTLEAEIAAARQRLRPSSTN